MANEECGVDGALLELAAMFGEAELEHGRCVGGLPNVSGLLESLQALVKQTHSVFFGCPWPIPCNLSPRHLLYIDLDVDWVQSEVLG